jgi:hypothetical protein
MNYKFKSNKTTAAHFQNSENPSYGKTLLTVKQISGLLGYYPGYVYTLTGSGKLKSILIESRRLIIVEDAIAFRCKFNGRRNNEKTKLIRTAVIKMGHDRQAYSNKSAAI